MTNRDQERIVSLQILRLFAATMVVLSHVAGLGHAIDPRIVGDPHRNLNAGGAAGVDIFFVLSGFVIALTGPLASPRPSALEFFWRRWRRVAPIYFLVSLPPLALALAAGSLGWPLIVSTYLFWPIAGNRFVNPIIGQGWTLCYEMSFYSLIALSLALGWRRAFWGVLALLAVRFLWPNEWILYLTNPLMLEFGIGVLLAHCRDWLGQLDVRLGITFVFAAVIVLGAEAYRGVGGIADPDAVMTPAVLGRVILFGVPAALTIAGAVICNKEIGGKLAQLLAAGGDASYAIYLTHVMSIGVVVYLWRLTNAPLYLAYAVAPLAAIGGGVAVHRLIEQPILRDLKRLRLPAVALALGR